MTSEWRNGITCNIATVGTNPFPTPCGMLPSEGHSIVYEVALPKHALSEMSGKPRQRTVWSLMFRCFLPGRF